MSDNLVMRNRIIMRQTFGIRVGPGLINLYKTSYLSAILQALFACQEFRIDIILIGHYYRRLHLHRNISYLYKHMVIGKEDFLIPEGIMDLLGDRFSELKEYEPENVMENMLQSLYESYRSYLRKQLIRNPYRNAAQMFLAHFEYQCTNKECELYNVWQQFNDSFGDNIWVTRLDIVDEHSTDGKFNIQKEMETFADKNYYLKRKNCHHCKNPTITNRWSKPNVLIIAIHPKQNMTDIDSVITVQNDNYSLFACICYESDERIHYCYTKLDTIWYCFKGRIVYEMPSLTQLRNVCLLFYKQVVTIDNTDYIEDVDSIGVIPALELPKQFVDSFHYERQPSFKPLMYTNVDLRSNNYDLVANQAFENRYEICYMNATIQALYHCRLFRKYIFDCYDNLGVYHKYLKNMFAAMKHRDQALVKLWHENFFRLFQSTNALEEHNIYFFSQIIDDLHKEIQHFKRNEGMVLYGNSEQFADKDYAMELIGREDMSSGDAWIRFMIEQNYSNMINMFAIQQMNSMRCRYGHKSFLSFEHSICVMIPTDVSTCGSFPSLQDIIDVYSGPLPVPDEVCNVCPNGVNDMYSFENLCISRASDILVFEFICLETNENENGDQFFNFVKLNIIVNELLYMFGQTYRCMAFSVYEDGINKPNHTFTCARTDDNNWCVFNDTDVYSIGNVMPQLDWLKPNENIEMVYYEKLINVIEMRSKTFDPNEWPLPLPPKTLADIRVEERQLQLSPQKPMKSLTIEASKVSLNNLYGNTSYMNAALQCLYHCLEFRKYIIFDQISNSNSTQMHSLLKWIFVNLSVTNLNCINSMDFWKAFTKKHTYFAKVQECDPNIFLSVIIKDLLEESEATFSETETTNLQILDDEWRNQTPISYNGCDELNKWNLQVVNTFGIIYQQYIYCKKGLHNRIGYKPEYKLVLALNSDSSLIQTIQSLINAYLMNFKFEPIICSDCMRTENVKIGKREAVKLVSLSRAPNILIIQLKIFVFDKNQRKSIRLKQYIQIDETIIINDEQLSFRSCICCSGPTLQSSHYYAYAVCDGQLYRFDDNNITPKTKIKSSSVYILFYEKL